MVRETGPTRGPPPMGPPGDDRPPFDMGPPGWGPPPGWPPLDEWGPPPPGGWGPMPPHDWGPPPPGGWGPRGPPPPDWDPRRPLPPGWPHPDDWLPPPDWRRLHPDDWRRLHPDDWRPVMEEWRHIRDVDWRTPRDGWRLPPEGWGPAHYWGPEEPPPPETWGPDGPPPPIPPIPPIPPPDPAAFGPMPVPPIPPPECVPPVPPPVPPFGFPAFPPPGWTEPPPVEEAMPNPPPDQPEWIKALISAPTSDSTGADPKTKTSSEDHLAIKPPEAAPAPVPPKPKKPKAAKPAKSLALLGKRTFEKPPPGRSTGIISFIGPTFGHVEREDLEKFTFSFDAFFGNPKAMTPGVRVHFTACKEKKNQIATDVKVAPGGTENVDPEIYEAVVSQPIVEPQPGERQYPGQVYVTIGPLRTNLSFERRDSTVTLLKEDQVLINLLSDLVTEKRRATNIRPKIPATFSHTKETRETGVIISLEDGVGIIRSDEHGEIPFEIRENFSDVEFTAEDINEEVEFTIIMLRNGKRAIRIRRVKEPLLLTLCSAATEASKEDDEDEDDEDEEDSDEANMPLFLKPKSRPEQGPNMKLDTELYEGIVSQPIIEPTTNMPGYPGQIHANIGPLRTNVTFDHRDCGVTLLKNDHVLINLLIDMTNKKRRAANIKPKIPFTFSYTKEKRELGIITFLGAEEGIVNSDDHGELPFDICENFSDTEFNSQDIHKEVEFTVAQVQMKKRAIRLMRTRKVNDKILEEQKKRCEEEEKKKKENEGEDQKRQEEDERRRKEEEEEERYKVAERKKKEEVAAALAAAQHKWTPFGFKMRDPDSQDEISKDRFEGTVLKAIGKHPQNEMKKELHDNTEESGGGGGALNGQTALQQQVKIKEEKEDESKPAAGEVQTEVKIKKEEEEEEVTKAQPTSDLGRLVMTIDGQQKQLPFGPADLLTTATMMDGDKVRFNVATNQVTKVERATYVEILPDSFEESTEQRRHGIVIEFSSDSGLIKCSQNPQLYFHMSEVIERKKLELNEKVEFSVVPHETAEGGNQAIRIKRYTESVFLPTRKLGGVGANKGKMTIKLTKPDVTEKEKPDTDKLKAVVKNLRAQDSRSRREYSATRRHYSSRSRSRSRSRGKSRSSSRSPPRDQFGRVTKRKRSPSIDRDRKSSRARRSRSHSREKRSRRTRSRSSSRSRSRSQERSKERSGKRRSKSSREREESHRRRKEFSPPPSRRPGLMDDELARKKRELEELNEMIAYKKSLVDPRGMDPGQRTCIDYDHGRIAVPLTEYQPVRSILKKRPEGPEYHHRPPPPYDDPYYDRPYQDHRYSDPYAKRYGDPYTSHPYPDRPYSERPFSDRPYESHAYSEVPYGAPPATSHRYTDRYDVYDEPFDDRYSDPVYADRRYTNPYPPSKRSQSPEPCRSSPTSQSTPVPGSSTQNLSTRPSAGPPFRPPSPAESPPRSPSPKCKKISPPVEKPPLDRFLDMLNKKKSDTGKVSEPIVHDDLLPHERALQDGRGFSRIVGLTQEHPSTNLPLEMEPKPQSPKPSSAERITKELNNTEEPYDKIQSLLRTIGLKLSTGDMSKLSNRTQEAIYSPKATSAKRDIPREEQRTTRTGSVESDRIHSPSPARSSSLEPRHTVVNEYEGFLDQQELEVLQKAQQLQSLTRTMGVASTTVPAPKHPPGSPPAQYQHLPSSMTWSLDTPPSSQSSSSLTQTPTTAAEPAQKLPRPPPGPPPGPPPRRPSLQTPPGPPPGPPPRRPPGQPPFIPTSSHVFPFIGQSSAAPPTPSSVSSQPPTTAATALPSTPATSTSSSNEDAAISTTVARCLKVIETVKSLAVQPPTKPVKSVQFSLPAASTPQASTEMEDETKTLQTEKMDLFNQRTTEKGEHEYQRKKQEKNKDGAEISPGKPIGSEQKNIWICGHSLVYWAESRSRSAEVGVHLGLDPRRLALWWKGVQGMTWPQLLPQLHQLKVTWPNPDVLIMHLGGNDLSTDSPTDLLASVRRDLTSMRTIFPRCVLVWSYILPRRVWRHSPDSYEVDLVRTTVNRRIHSIVSELGGASLTHDNIRCGTNTGLYRADGIHLSPKGIDMFNLNVRDFLEKWDADVNKTE